MKLKMFFFSIVITVATLRHPVDVTSPQPGLDFAMIPSFEASSAVEPRQKPEQADSEWGIQFETLRRRPNEQVKYEKREWASEKPV